MTGLPSPSNPPESAKHMAFALFRPVLFSVTVIALALDGLVLTHRSNPEIAALKKDRSPDSTAPSPSSTLVLPEPEAVPPVGMAEFRGFGDLKGFGDIKGIGDLKGFQMKKPDPAAEPEPPASDLYELTLRLERGDTVEKMLADIDVPEVDRKQIAEKLSGLLKKRKLATGETIDLMRPTIPEQPDAPRVLSLSVRPQP